MTLDIETYLKNKPDLKGGLVKLLGFSNIKSLYGTSLYKYLPIGTKSGCIFITLDESPSRYSGDYFYFDDPDTPKEKGMIIPKEFIDKVTKDNGILIGDEELCKILAHHPELNVFLPEHKRDFGIAKFANGKPTYNMGFSTQITASEEVVRHMCGLANFFALNYNGIIWDDQSEEFGEPDKKKIHELGSSAFNTLKELLSDS